MRMKFSKELVKGSTAMLVLSVLSGGAMYGYQIIKELEAASESAFSMNEGTLYPILHALEGEKYLEAFWEEGASARRRRYYRITEKGVKELERQKDEWKSFSSAIEKVLRGTSRYAR